MRMIIAGSRGADREEDYQALKAYVMANCAKPSEIVSGTAKGGDQQGERLAAEFGLPVTRMPADWDKHGKGAGYIRNGDMAIYASDTPGGTLVALWDGKSPGTENMIKVAGNYGLAVHVINVKPVELQRQDLTSLKDVTPAAPYIFPQSYSSLNVFDTCPRQYEAKYLTKEVPYVQSPEARWGDEVHMELEQYVKAQGNYQLSAQCLDPNGSGLSAASFKPQADWVITRAMSGGGQIIVERQLGVDGFGHECSYKDRSRRFGGKIDITILYPQKGTAEVLDWKGLPLDTPLPTPTGWTTMGEVKVGDALYSRSGSVCAVIGKSQVKNIRCYAITFDDATTQVCDENHLWVTTDDRVVGVTDLTTKDRIPLVSPVVGCGELPLDPYVLGVWLADGKHTSSEVSKPDGHVWEEMARRGFTFGTNTGTTCVTRTVLGIRKYLRALGVLGNKNIPRAYMRASVDDRVALLRGIMDGDGYANPGRKQAVCLMTRQALINQIRELVLSLGERAGVCVTEHTGFGKRVTAWQVSWRPQRYNPFSDPRKARVMDVAMLESTDSYGRKWKARDYRRVTRVVEVPSVPTQCIAVDSPDHTFVCSTAWLPTHNTGKIRDDRTQLQFYAGLILAHHRDINTVGAGYVWLAQNQVSPPSFYGRADYNLHWETFQNKYSKLKAAYVRGVFEPKPNGLCQKWCDVKSCEYHGKGRR